MAINQSGEMAGSVSGGCVEGAVVEEAMTVLKTGRPKLLQYGVADETAWEVGLACVVLKPNSDCPADELMQQMRDNLAPYKVPKRVEILAELPISGAGKILKRELQDRFK